MSVVRRQHDGLHFPVLCRCEGCQHLYDVQRFVDFEFKMAGEMPVDVKAVCPDCGHDVRPVDDEDTSDLIKEKIPAFAE